jgi:hypothetical protein
VAFSTEIQGELDASLLPWRDVSTRKMFGSMVYMAGDKMFAFIHDDKLVVKLPQQEKARAAESGGARPFVHGQNGQFGDWMEFPLASPEGIEGAIPWIKQSYRYVRVASTDQVRKSGRTRQGVHWDKA